MFDAIGAFAKQFTPVEGGYLYYSSPKTGGKLVTVEEYEYLEADWERVAGRKGQWKLVGVVGAAIVLWMLASQTVAPPNWADAIFMAGLVLSISGWFFWASFAPRRLVKDRPVVTPPEDITQYRRDARALLNWRFVIFVLLFSGVIFGSTLSSTERTTASWAWLIGSGLIFGGYVWIAFQKIADERR